MPPRHEVQRLFFALWPDAALRQRVAAATARLAASQGIGGRRLRPDRYHLTLQFLGSFDPLPEAVVDAAMVAADDVRGAGFTLTLDRSGSFGGKRVGWLGPTRMPPGLQAFWQALGLALDRHGVPRESSAASPWTPHVTVVRGLRRVLPAVEIAPLAWPVDGFVLIRSQYDGTGYTVLQHWRLGERAGV